MEHVTRTSFPCSSIPPTMTRPAARHSTHGITNTELGFPAPGRCLDNSVLRSCFESLNQLIHGNLDLFQIGSSSTSRMEFASAMGCGASLYEVDQQAKLESPKETSTFHFILKEHPAVLRKSRSQRLLGPWVSFPEKFKAAWESLMTHDTAHALGQHSDDNPQQCLCVQCTDLHR